MFHPALLLLLTKPMNQIQKLLNNPHTSSSGLIALGCVIVGIIWPQYNDKATKILEAAIAYGLVQAGDAKPQAVSDDKKP